jgi:type IV pilus biogenesis protein CpaD/CtpE
MRALLQKSALTAILAASLAACAGSSGKPADAGKPSTSTHKSPVDLAPGEQIDYAGHRCGNANLHVKTHLCLFPRR